MKVAQALESLSEARRQVFVLRELQGLSGEEIAAALGIPIKTVFHAVQGLAFDGANDIVHGKSTSGGGSTYWAPGAGGAVLHFEPAGP